MKTLEQVIAQFPPQVRERYDFGGAAYHGALAPITGIVCPKHGEFQQYAAQLRKDGAGCPKCGAEQRAQTRRMKPDEFIRRAEEVHPGRFDYIKTTYVNMTTKVVVTCRKHGDFEISPIKLVYGKQGCPVCAVSTRGYQKDMVSCRLKTAASKRNSFRGRFVERARAVHGARYDYSDHGYVTARQKVRVRCPKHGDFEQAAGKHLAGQGCPSCNNVKSAPEDALAAFLSIFTTVVRRDRTIIAPKEIDILLPEHKLAVEFCGMYWHSHGSKEDEAKNKLRHAEKHRLCAEKGYQLLTIYETEWSARPQVVKRLLRNAMGRMRGRLMARKCRLGTPSAAEAAAFYEAYHPQGGAGAGEHYGLYYRGRLVACMRFAFGNNDRGAAAKERRWTLSRYATRLPVAGAASKLFKAFLAEHCPLEVKSFSDNRLFAGGMYEQLGFVLEQNVDPDYQVWSPKLGLRPKSHYQRRVLQKRLKEHGVEGSFDPKTDPRTEAEVTYLMGARRIYDCGKKRWVWTLLPHHATLFLAGQHQPRRQDFLP
jgi:G:T-mismatch repair DNA endonuclease (very short patch repair protein)